MTEGQALESGSVKMLLNVGGSEFYIKTAVLDKYPYGRLSRLRDCRGLRDNAVLHCDEYDLRKDEYYFDRDPEAFSYIVKCYEEKAVHLPRSICPIRFAEETSYWGIADAPLDQCCRERLRCALIFIEELGEEVRKKMRDRDHNCHGVEMNLKTIHKFGDIGYNISKIRWKIWLMFMEPSSLVAGKLWAMTSVGFIVLSLATFVIGTLKRFQEFNDEGFEIENAAIALIEKICIYWFTVEYFIRLIVAPNKLAYVRQIMNVIDLVTIIPYYVQMYFTYRSEGDANLESVSHSLQIFRVMRVMRVFRLGRHSSGLQVLCKTLIRSSTELALLALYLVIGIILLASAEYTVEEECFKHLGEALWWATITVTTVGYGDVYPETLAGKIIASLSFTIGLLAIGLPIHPIIANFTHYYKRSAEVEYAFRREMRHKVIK